jgi:polyisoprenoid-binding protein YceI
MLQLLISSTLIVLLAASTAHARNGKLTVDVTLSPAGSFKVETLQVEGYAIKKNGGIEAKNVKIDLRNIQTGIGLRDKHTKERLLVTKYPQAKLISATGKNGKGQAVIEIKGRPQKVEGTYTVSGDTVKAQFPLKLADLQINNVRYMGVGVKDTVLVNIVLPLKDKPREPVAGRQKSARNISGK